MLRLREWHVRKLKLKVGVLYSACKNKSEYHSRNEAVIHSYKELHSTKFDGLRVKVTMRNYVKLSKFVVFVIILAEWLRSQIVYMIQWRTPHSMIPFYG